MDGTGQNQGGRRWSIGHQLVLLLLVVLAPFVLLEAARGVQDVRRGRESVAELALGQVEEEAETMDDFVRFTDRYLSTLAADPAVRTLDMPRVGALFQVVQDLNPNYINVFLLTPDGEQIASTTPLVSDPDITERPYFQQALSSGQVVQSDALALPDTGRSYVVFAKRVNGTEGQPIGVLCIALNVARLSTVIGFVALPEGSVVSAYVPPSSCSTLNSSLNPRSERASHSWKPRTSCAHRAMRTEHDGSGAGAIVAWVRSASRST